jgi:hypothetical protein
MVYVTLLIGGFDKNDSSLEKALKSHAHSTGHVQSRQRYLNRTICFQNRLRALNSSYPLLVLHDFNEDLSPYFDLTRRINASAVRRGTLQAMRLNKLLAWGLEEFERVILMDSDIYIQTLPDELFARPFTNGSLIGATTSCIDTHFNSGFIVLTPSMNILCDMLDYKHKIRHSCTGNFFDDQAFLNTYYNGNFTHLEKKWNTQLKYHGVPVLVNNHTNVHFTGSLKPRWHVCDHGTYTKVKTRETRGRSPR